MQCFCTAPMPQHPPTIRHREGLAGRLRTQIPYLWRQGRCVVSACFHDWCWYMWDHVGMTSCGMVWSVQQCHTAQKPYAKPPEFWWILDSMIRPSRLLLGRFGAKVCTCLQQMKFLVFGYCSGSWLFWWCCSLQKNWPFAGSGLTGDLWSHCCDRQFRGFPMLLLEISSQYATVSYMYFICILSIIRSIFILSY